MHARTWHVLLQHEHPPGVVLPRVVRAALAGEVRDRSSREQRERRAALRDVVDGDDGARGRDARELLVRAAQRVSAR